MREYRRELYVVGIGIIVIAASFVVGRTVGAHDAYQCESDASFACVEAYYQSVIQEDGARAALSDLHTRYDAGGAARTFCHPLLHLIGAAAAHEYGSANKAFRYGETFCRSGYYHGVLEGLFGESGEQFLAELDLICTDIPGKERYSYQYYSCVHGIGHGLMSFFDHEVFKSIEGCDKLSGAWEKSSCYGGVFMENVISDTPEMPSRFLKLDDPLYPCNAVEDTYRYQCYQMQTSHMLVIFDGDFEKAFATCRAVEGKYRATCYQSLGRDASGWSDGDGEKASALCAMGKTEEERTQCLIGAAIDFIQLVGPEEARSLCALAENPALCTQALDMQLKAL